MKKEGTLLSPQNVQEDDDDAILEAKESEYFFCPEKGNVAFASATDCWAFNLTTFARKIALRFGMNPRILQ